MSVLTAYWNDVSRVDAQSTALRDGKLATYGTIGNYLSHLKQGVIASADTQDFKDFYDLYAGIFTLPEEREEPEGFARAFALEHDATLQAQQGPYAERALYVRDPDTGEMVGAVNYFVTARRDGEDLDGLDGMSQINYLFVDERYRKMGIGSHLVEAVEKASRDFIREHGPAAVRAGEREPVMASLCEQNAPLKMTAGEYMQDNKNALIDQCDRLKWWQGRGFRRLDFNYVQPPLEDGGEPCTTLTLNAKMPPGVAMTDKILGRFLENFFTVSVLKGEDISGDPDYRAMRAEIATKGTVATFDDRAELPAMKQRILNQLTALDAAGKLEADERPLALMLALDGEGPVPLSSPGLCREGQALRPQ
jgi:GNAT superfamily N-acetyltransferase